MSASKQLSMMPSHMQVGQLAELDNQSLLNMCCYNLDKTDETQLLKVLESGSWMTFLMRHGARESE
jgi:predicted transcriptional regulator